MIKKIRCDQLRVGMHVHEFCGSWMDHPFWRAKFTLRTQAEVQRIVTGGVTEVFINTDKGADVEGGISQEEINREVEHELTNFVSLPALAEPKGQQVDFEAEAGSAMGQAAALVRRSVPKITSMFGEARLGKAMDVSGCESLVEQISSSVLADPGALISVARLKTHDEYTYMHSIAVCALMIALGRQLRLKDDLLRKVGLAGMLHDLGKALMPLEVLNKPGKLTDAEYEIMKTHPVRGHALLKEGKGAGPVVLEVYLHHHEKFDGTGYPHGLAGDKLSLVAKMGAVCDVYDAITSERPYKSGWDPGEALRRMTQWKGHFDPVVFQAFVKAVGIYPIGSLVRLHSGRLAVVTEQNADSLLTPKVKVFYSMKSGLRIEPVELNLAHRLAQDQVVGCESPDDWDFKDLDKLWLAS